MLPVSCILLSMLLAASANAHQCDLVQPRYWLPEVLLLASQKTWYAQQQYGAVTILSSKCYSLGYYVEDISLIHNAFDAPYTYYDKSNKKQAVIFRSYIVGNKAKYYVIVNNKEVTLTVIALSRHWIVVYGCQEGQGAVIIMTTQKTRNEQLIAEATVKARKVVRLPLYSRDMHCNLTDL